MNRLTKMLEVQIVGSFVILFVKFMTSNPSFPALQISSESRKFMLIKLVSCQELKNFSRNSPHRVDRVKMDFLNFWTAQFATPIESTYSYTKPSRKGK